MSRWGIELSEFALVTLQKKTKNKNTLSLCESSRKKGVNLFDSCSRPKSPLGILYRDKSHFVKKIIQLCSSCFVYFSAKMTLEDESEL